MSRVILPRNSETSLWILMLLWDAEVVELYYDGLYRDKISQFRFIQYVPKEFGSTR